MNNVVKIWIIERSFAIIILVVNRNKYKQIPEKIKLVGIRIKIYAVRFIHSILVNALTRNSRIYLLTFSMEQNPS